MSARGSHIAAIGHFPHAQLSLGKSAKKAALSPSRQFEKTSSEEEVQKTSKGCIPVNATRSTRSALRTFTVSSAPLEITHPDRRDPGGTIQIWAPSDITLLGNVCRFRIGMQLWRQFVSRLLVPGYNYNIYILYIYASESRNCIYIYIHIYTYTYVL